MTTVCPRAPSRWPLGVGDLGGLQNKPARWTIEVSALSAGANVAPGVALEKVAIWRVRPRGVHRTIGVHCRAAGLLTLVRAGNRAATEYSCIAWRRSPSETSAGAGSRRGSEGESARWPVRTSKSSDESHPLYEGFWRNSVGGVVQRAPLSECHARPATTSSASGSPPVRSVEISRMAGKVPSGGMGQGPATSESHHRGGLLGEAGRTPARRNHRSARSTSERVPAQEAPVDASAQ